MALSVVKGTIERVLDKNLQDLVRGIRNHKHDETKYIHECLEEIKYELRINSASSKSNAVLKLIYLQMLGFEFSWASFNVVEIMSSPKFAFKRIGYLAASQGFHQGSEVLMLTTNLIRKDICSSKIYDAGNALSGLACFITPELAANLYVDVIKMTSSNNPYLRKKAILLLYKIFINHPESLPEYFTRLKEKLEDPDPGVQSAAVNVICELARKNPKNYLSLAPIFFKLMTTSSNNWVLIKIIKLFGTLTSIEPRLGKKLIEPLTNLIHSTSAMSLLYECVNTVVSVLISISSGIPNHLASIQLCVQKLRILIEDSDQNLKYLGLLAMTKIMRHHPKSVESHKDLILCCLDDKDESIRLRALNLLQGMVTKQNLSEIVKILVQHVSSPSTSSHFRNQLVGKIIQLCSEMNYELVTSFEWYISVLVELSCIDTVSNGNALSSQLIEVAIRVPSVRLFCVNQMSILFDLCCSDENLVSRPSALLDAIRAASWICGEYGTLLDNPTHTMESMLTVITRASGLSGSIRAITLLNTFKLYCSIVSGWIAELRSDCKLDWILNDLIPRVSGITAKLTDNFAMLMQSAHLEVQERAVTFHQLLRLISDRLEHFLAHANNDADSLRGICNGDSAICHAEHNLRDELASLGHEVSLFFAGDINPVAPNAQRKVPVPEGLDLDVCINGSSNNQSLASNSLGEKDMNTISSSTRGLRFTKRMDSELFPLSSLATKVTLTQEQLDEMRRQRLQRQQDDPFYLKPAPDKSNLSSEDKVSNESPNVSGRQDTTVDKSPVRRLARPDQFVKEIQHNLNALCLEKSKTEQSEPPITRTNRRSSSPTIDFELSKTPSLVRVDMDMPPGMKAIEGDASEQEANNIIDLNPRLSIPSDTKKDLVATGRHIAKKSKRMRQCLDEIRFIAPPISNDHFAKLVQSGQLSHSVNAKCKCPLLDTDSSVSDVARLVTNQLPCHLVESIDENIVSLYAEGFGSNEPICILLKRSNQPGFANVAIRSSSPRTAPACLARMKRILGQLSS